MNARTAAVVGLLAAAVVVGAGGPATASCAGPMGPLKQELKSADYVFVGTVTDVAADGRQAAVSVESVWRGEVGEQVQVVGGATRPGTVTSVDRDYTPGRRYLFVPHAWNGQAFQDNICTPTQEWKPRLQRLRPPDATPVGNSTTTETPSDEPGDPSESGSAGSEVTAATSPAGWIVGGAGLAALAALGVMWVRRRAPR